MGSNSFIYQAANLNLLVDNKKKKKVHVTVSTFAKVCFFSLNSKLGKPPPELLKPFILPL
jgi:hypothetical protein